MNQSFAPEFAQVMPEFILTGLSKSIISFFSPPQTSGPSGALPGTGDPSTYTPVPGLVNIVCMNAPVSPARIQATEVRDMKEILSKQYRHVLLTGYYPNIPKREANAGWIVSIDDQDGLGPVFYEMLGAEDGSQELMTRIHVGLLGV